MPAHLPFTFARESEMIALSWAVAAILGVFVLIEIVSQRATLKQVERSLDVHKATELRLHRDLKMREAELALALTQLDALHRWLEKSADHCSACRQPYAPSSLSARYDSGGEARFLCNSCLHIGGNSH